MSCPADFDLAGTVARLFIHPVKSCAGIEVQQALLTDTGLEWDRAWMVVDAQGAFLTQRALPRMALVRPQMTAADLVLHAPGQAPLKVPLAATGLTAAVRVWNDTVPAWDMGDAAAHWFSGFLGQPCRLVRFDPAQRRLSSLEWTGGAEAPNQFADGFPLLVASTAGLEALNAQLAAVGQGGVGIERFRPNLVLGGVEAHDEDRVDLLHIDTGAGGAVQLQPVKPCVRCPIPDIDPASAERGTQVGDALRRYRQDARMGGAITFGMNAIVRRGAGQVLCVGQPLGAHYRFG
ncbi:MOSC domain-containing protein [Acidovorax sp. SRB_14]|uniref:MOSC domain-containing protein n=1 Tax=Acidovorax sp. SRB_14 TaxID=1962699 RepID=UPI001566319A|nr:MOSC domain-containing protein [Acidovorax sp. SRB_14]